MKILIQKVKYAKLLVKDRILGEINDGYLIYLGIEKFDENREEEIVNKLLKIKFIDDGGKFKKSLSDLDKKIYLMIIPNVTLIAKIEKNKPEFNNLSKDVAKNIYDKFLSLLASKNFSFVNGVFGEEMIIESQNAGPINFILNL